jgi:hypothetical protein
MNFFIDVLKNFLKRNGYEKMADVCDKSISTVYRWVEHESGIDMPAKYIPLLTKITKDFTLIENLTSLCGGYFVKLDAAGEINKHSMLVKLAILTQNFSALLKTSSKAIEDGNIDEKEARAIVYDLNQLISLLGQLKFDMENQK